MRLKDPIIERVLSAFRAVLPAATRVKLVAAHGQRVELAIAGQRVRAQWLSTGLPGDVRERAAMRPRPDVAVARALSPGAKDALSRLRIGWIDETGAAELALKTIVVSRSGRPQPPAPRRTEQWTPALLAVAEALLCGVRPTVEATCEATELSGGACGNALRRLTDAGLLAARAARGRASARSIVDQRAFLAAYAAQAVARPHRTPPLVVGVTWRDMVHGLRDVGRSWTHQGIAWAATGPVAAAVMAPLLTNVGSATVYVDASTTAELVALAARSDLPPLDGGRLTLAPFPTTSTRLLARSAGSLRVAPWPRVYADLRVTGVRGEEAAEHLLEVVNDRGT